MRLSELHDEYVLYARAANRSQATITSQDYHLRRFVQFLDRNGYEPDSEVITAKIIREFIADAQTTYAPKTVANNVRALKTLFNFAVNEELVTTDPTRRIAVPKVPDRDYEVFDASDVDRLLKACDTKTVAGLRDFAIVILLFDSGIRASELVGLRDDSIDWERGLLTVYGKGSKERAVPVSGRTLRAIRRYVNRRNREYFDSKRVFVNASGAPLTASGLLQLLERLGTRTGLHVHPHKFRHSFAVSALRNDATLADVQDALGHTTLLMTKRYARQSAVDLAKHHKRFSPADRLTTRV